MLPIVSWCAAQICKTIIDLIMNGKLNAERLFGAGGMPSAHSALVCSLFIGSARKYGLDDPIFALSFVLAMIVMYDAMGVRLETGKQAKVLNRILDDLKEEGQTAHRPLKEMVGHTPLQVVSGALLGILIALLIPVF
ncbi:divergent PAP2 family protein [Ruminococcaceae bacterium OttesenSCG-928-I18]|nr:divergent PAP2 family protein [Ruminococcaceae bacterium OttesenSCG-928-I18]